MRYNDSVKTRTYVRINERKKKMEKFIVIVNRKYLVSVEAGSHGGAEHRCLDLIYGIDTAQAFSRDDLRTECFRDNAIDCETISFAELAERSKSYEQAMKNEKEARKAIEENEKKIAELEREIALIMDNNDILKYNIQCYVEEQKSII